MDQLLQKENLNLELMPYKVLATGKTSGMVQFVSALPLSQILADYGGSLVNYLKQESLLEMKTVMDIYIKSCGLFR
jgi:phosphatidylinositol 3-kinase